MSSEPSQSKRSKINHDLKAYFEGLSDDEIVQELSAYPTVRQWTRATLKAVATLEVLHAQDRNPPKKDTDHHQAVLYYLKTHRPDLLLKADREAEELAAKWPHNYRDLEVFQARGWWWNAIRRRLSASLRERYPNISPKGWVNLIWPVCLKIMSEDATLEGLRIQDAEYMLISRVFIPTRMTFKGELIYKEVKKLIRHKIMDYRAENPVRD